MICYKLITNNNLAPLASSRLSPSVEIAKTLIDKIKKRISLLDKSSFLPRAYMFLVPIFGKGSSTKEYEVSSNGAWILQWMPSLKLKLAPKDYESSATPSIFRHNQYLKLLIFAVQRIIGRIMQVKYLRRRYFYCTRHIFAIFSIARHRNVPTI